MCKGPVAGENLTLEKQSRLVWLQCEAGSLVSSLVPASTGGQCRGRRCAPHPGRASGGVKSPGWEGELLEST